MANLLDFFTCAERVNVHFLHLRELNLQVTFQVEHEHPYQLWNVWLARCNETLAAVDAALASFLKCWGVPVLHVECVVHSWPNGSLSEMDAQGMVALMLQNLHGKKMVRFRTPPPQRWLDL